MIEIIKEVLTRVTTETQSTYELNLDATAGEAVINTPENAGFVRKSAQEFYGEDKVSHEGLPVYASEDFSEFLTKAPGCLFFRALGHLEPGITLHNNRYNFDDEAIDDLSHFWFKIMLDRLTC